jgi:hypothetical protein
MDCERDYAMARFALTLSAGAAVAAMLIMGMILLPLAPYLPTGEKKAEVVGQAH